MPQTKTTEVQKYITSLAYPCSRDELADHARRNGAKKDVIQTILELPYDYFSSPYAVWDAMK